MNWSIRKASGLTRFACICPKRGVLGPRSKWLRVKRHQNKWHKTCKQRTRMNKKSSDSKTMRGNSWKWLRPGDTQKWRKIFSRGPRKNADTASRRLLTATIWNRSEPVMSQWRGSWNVTIAIRTGGIDRNVYKIDFYKISWAEFVLNQRNKCSV